MKISQSNKSVTMKLLVTGGIMVLLLIPLLLVQNVIAEREQYQRETYADIASSWGHGQMITGPVLTVPYVDMGQHKYKLANGETLIEEEMEVKYVHFLPSELRIDGELKPQSLHRGIYEVPVFTADLDVSGSFQKPWLDVWNDSTQVLWDQTFLTIGLNDNRSIDALDLVTDGVSGEIKPGRNGSGGPLKTGVYSLVETAEDGLEFKMKLALKGSEEFSVVPVGKKTHVKLSSPWTAPSFFGSFLPDERPDDFSEGFDASWNILEINRAIPSNYVDETLHLEHLAFGVKLKEETSDYSKTERSTKYAVLMIALVFLALVAIQLVRGHWFHPLQLGILGIGLVLFYLLLLSLSEVIGFNAAYAVASLVMSCQMGWYLYGLMKSLKATLIYIGVLGLLYVFTFVLVQMVMYSLLVGTLGLLIALAVMMVLSKRLPALGENAEQAIA